jgi:parallel beta-helix repeat protein
MLNNADSNRLVNNSAFNNEGDGIRLEYSNDNILSTNIATNNSDGIGLFSSNNNYIIRNQAYNNTEVGIHLRPASYNLISNNTVDHSGAQGIYVGESEFNNISGNRVTNTIFSGIVLHSSNNHILSQNSVSHNGAEGIVLERSDYNSILDNVINNNVDYGVALKIWWGEGPDPSNYNLVKWNTFIGHPEGFSQAFDEGKENIFVYNYWDDWMQPDADANGIVDLPYPIDVVAIVGDPLKRNQDPYPLVRSFSFVDSDGDGMDDLYESTMGLDPNTDDSTGDLDQDELLNLEEYQLGTWANDPDSENDGLEDGFEVQMGLNPLVNDAASDLDGDGMPNLWEAQMGLNLADPQDAGLDLDEDGLLNLQEYHLGLNATTSDTDTDKMPDNWEVAMGLNGADPQDALQDPDGDGLNNLQEYRAGTDPNNPDSDGDFFQDGVDYGWWGNPRANWDNPLTRGLLAILLVVLTGLSTWAGFIAYALPKLQLELKRQLLQIQRQIQQFKENSEAIDSSKSLQELGETSKRIHQDFESCKAALIDAQSLITRKWIPSFVSPDLTPLKMLTKSLNATYTQVTQEYLKRVEILMDE